MRELFSIDCKDYSASDPRYVRPSVRAIICENDRLAMVYSRKLDYYKFPGGGIETGETHADALVREVAEEVGLCVDPATIRPFGHVRRIEKGTRKDVLEQDNFYYFCDTVGTAERALDPYEAEEGFELRWVDAEDAARKNLAYPSDAKNPVMVAREAQVLGILMREGIVPPHAR